MLVDKDAHQRGTITKWLIWLALMPPLLSKTFEFAEKMWSFAGVRDYFALHISSKIKGRQMGHYVMISLWCDSLLTNTRFRILCFRMIDY